MTITFRHGVHASLWFGPDHYEDGPCINAKDILVGGRHVWQLRFHGESDAQSYAQSMLALHHDVESIADEVLRGLGNRFFATWIAKVQPDYVMSAIAAGTLIDTPIWRSDAGGDRWASPPIEREWMPSYSFIGWPEAQMRAEPNIDEPIIKERDEDNGVWL